MLSATEKISSLDVYRRYFDRDRKNDVDLLKRVLSPLLYLAKDNKHTKNKVESMAVVQRPRYAMSSSTSSSVSRLSEMKARFQQKQLQEKEQKLLALYEDQARQAYQRVGPGNGKVRQLFQERRGHNHNPGWDKSYPLEPIPDNRRERGSSLDRNSNSVWRPTPVRRAKSQVRKEQDELQSSRVHEPVDQLVFKYNTPLYGDDSAYLSQFDSSRLFRKLPNIGGTTLADTSGDRFKTYIASKPAIVTMAPAKDPKVQTRITDVGSLTKSLARMSPPSKKIEVRPTALPTATKQSKPSPPASSIPTKSRIPSVANQTPARPTPRLTSDTDSQKMSKPAGTVRAAGPTRTVAPAGVPRTGTQGSGASRAPATRAPPPRGPQTGGRSDLAYCNNCQRGFAPDRIQAHTEICMKTSRKKRKPFDATKHRVKGTELEAYVKKGRPSVPPPSLNKSNWRRKHEEFISNIRAAKEAQAHVARGGKLSDLPPPPPLDTSDYTQCPHCKRKFNQGAAERHIPKCATMQHNKPKPAAAKTRTTVTRKY